VDGGINIIPTGSPHPKEAFELLQYMTTTQPELQFNQVIGNTPTVKSADRLVTNPCMKTIINLEMGSRSAFFPVLPVSNQYNSGISTAEDQVLRGKATPQQAMGNLKQTIQSALNAAH
jgi:multiple sugar transport system substrate-binding protein